MSFKNPFDFDDYDQNQIIKLQPTSDNTNSQPEDPKKFAGFKSEQIHDHEDYEIKLENRESERYSHPKENPQKQTNQHLEEPQAEMLTEEQVIMITSTKQQAGKYASYSGHGSADSQLNQDGDPPLLEDIGLDPGLIVEKFMLILKFQKPTVKHAEMTDLAGPIFLAFSLGFLLLGAGKVHFGDIYSLFIGGNILICVFLNLISQTTFISLYTVMSVLGYSMLPMLIPGAISLIFSLKNQIGILILICISIWSSISATVFMEIILEFTDTDRKGILMYPLFLYYISFAIIIVF